MNIVKILHEPYSTALETTHGNRNAEKWKESIPEIFLHE